MLILTQKDIQDMADELLGDFIDEWSMMGNRLNITLCSGLYYVVNVPLNFERDVTFTKFSEITKCQPRWLGHSAKLIYLYFEYNDGTNHWLQIQVSNISVDEPASEPMFI